MLPISRQNSFVLLLNIYPSVYVVYRVEISVFICGVIIKVFSHNTILIFKLTFVGFVVFTLQPYSFFKTHGIPHILQCIIPVGLI